MRKNAYSTVLATENDLLKRMKLQQQLQKTLSVCNDNGMMYDSRTDMIKSINTCSSSTLKRYCVFLNKLIKNTTDEEIKQKLQKKFNIVNNRYEYQLKQDNIEVVKKNKKKKIKYF